jgi:hypothetical protein
MYKDWSVSREEWRLLDVSLTEEEYVRTCKHGHTTSNGLCVITNRPRDPNRRGYRLKDCGGMELCSECVTQVLGINTEALLRCCRRIQADPSKPLSVNAALVCCRMEWLNDQELKFCLKTAHKRKRKLSARQLERRVEINGRVVYLALTSPYRDEEYKQCEWWLDD